MKPLLLILLALAAAPALANDALLAKCRQEPVAELRLACYDAIPGPARPAGTAAATAATAAPAAAKAPVAPAAITAPINPSTAATAVAPQAPAATSRFGLPSPAAEAVDSRIAGRVEGWGPRTRFTLANGQVWEVEDGSSAALWLENPAVRVRRGLVGAYYLEIEGTNRSPRVRRLQ